MVDESLPSKRSFELDLYQANACPAELLLPYSLSSEDSKFFIVSFLKSKFKQSLWNMDSPLVMSVVMIGTLHLIASFALAILSVFESATSTGTMALAPLILMPLSLLLFTFPLYAVIVGTNLATYGGKNWSDKLLGPTSVGLTESGFKLWWQGFAFYNYPNLAVWSDIFFLDFKDDDQTGEPSLHFVYQSGFGRRTVELPLRGFQSKEDAHLVLAYFARYVLADNQSEKFREQLALNFEGSFKRLTFNTDNEKE